MRKLSQERAAKELGGFQTNARTQASQPENYCERALLPRPDRKRKKGLVFLIGSLWLLKVVPFERALLWYVLKVSWHPNIVR